MYDRSLKDDSCGLVQCKNSKCVLSKMFIVAQQGISIGSKNTHNTKKATTANF